MTPLPPRRRTPSRWAALAVLALHALVAAALWQGLRTATGAAPPPPQRQHAATWLHLVAVAEQPAVDPPAALPAPAAARPPALRWIDVPVVLVPPPAARGMSSAAAPAAEVAAEPFPGPAPPVTARETPPSAGGALAASTPAPPALPAPAPALQPPPGAVPVRHGADHRDCLDAPYPAALRERGIEGQLRLRVHVTPEGRAAEVRLVASSGWRLFDEAAIAQARGCRFRPAREDGRAVADWVEFPVRFALDG